MSLHAFTAKPFAKVGELHLHHYVEWLDSFVSDDFIKANVRSLEGEEAFEKVAGYAHQKAGEKANQCANAEVRRINRSYASLYAGGWWVSGVDPLANWEPMEWGQLKPDQPRPNFSKPGSFHKYEAPKGVKGRLFVPEIPLAIARGILERYNLTAPKDKQVDLGDMQAAVLWEEGGFWGWFAKHPEIPLLITEGAKKTGAACSAGFATIGLTGFWGGREPKERDENGVARPNQNPPLRKELLAFAQPGRKIIFAFDQDEKIKTQMDMWAATSATAFLFLKDTKAQPYFTNWEFKQGKGIDDFVAANGPDEFAKIVAAAKSYQDWKLENQLCKQLSREADIEINQASLKGFDFSRLPSEGIVAIVAAKGTGKTQHFLKPLVEDEASLLLIGHLVKLTTSNSLRMGATYRTQLDRAAGRFLNEEGEPVYRISTVINSLLSFSPRDFDGSVIVLDEVCQLFRAALTSKHVAKDGRRGAILTRLREVLQRARLIVSADADLNDWALNYLEALRGDGKPAFLVENSFVQEGYKVHFYEGKNSSALVDDALAAYQAELAKGSAGKHIAIAVDSKKKAKVIADMAQKSIKGASVLPIHSDTVEGELEKRFIDNPDEWLEGQSKPVLVVYSPSMGTGVSIETDTIGHVFGAFEGASITDTDILQMLGRVRIPCDRSVWVKCQGNAYSNLGKSSSPAVLKEQLKNLTNTAAATIRQSLTETAYSGLTSFTWDTDPHIEAYCQIEAERNRAMPALRSRVRLRLEAEGNRIGIRNQWENPAMAQAMASTGKDLELAEAQAIESREMLDEAQAKAIAGKECATLEERQALTKYHLADFYCAEITAELILADKKGERRSQVKAYEELMDAELSHQRDVEAIERQMRWGQLSPQDIRSGAVKSEIRSILGLQKWIERTDSWQGGCAELEEFKALCLRERVREGIKNGLNYTVKPEVSAQQILSELLRQVGVKVKSELKQANGSRERYYFIEPESLAELKELANKRAQKRTAKQAEAEAAPATQWSDHPPDKSDHPPRLIKKIKGGDHLVLDLKIPEVKITHHECVEAGGATQLEFASVAAVPSVLADDFYDAGAWE